MENTHRGVRERKSALKRKLSGVTAYTPLKMGVSLRCGINGSKQHSAAWHLYGPRNTTAANVPRHKNMRSKGNGRLRNSRSGYARY